MSGYHALVLAGRRSSADPLADFHGDTHPALLEIAGMPMLVRVVRALRDTRCVEQITVSIDRPSVLEAIPELQGLLAGGELDIHTSLESPSRSVSDAVSGVLPDHPALIVTADHALLTPEIVTAFIDRADASSADVVVGMVSEKVIRARYPETKRTYLRFRDGGYSGANLFALRTRAAQQAAEFWVRAEQFRKRPWRLASVFGPVSLALFALRRLTLDAAIERASRAIGCRVSAVQLPFAEAAIDVDRPSDLELVEQILARRASAR